MAHELVYPGKGVPRFVIEGEKGDPYRALASHNSSKPAIKWEKSRGYEFISPETSLAFRRFGNPGRIPFHLLALWIAIR